MFKHDKLPVLKNFYISLMSNVQMDYNKIKNNYCPILNMKRGEKDE